MSRAKNKRVLLRGWGRLPIQVPPQILEHQASLGPLPSLVWINLVALAQQKRSLQIDEIAEQMGLAKQEINQALALLADWGWINDEGLEIQLAIPLDLENQEEAAVTVENILDEEQASFEWLISYWSARIKAPSPKEMRKLFFWMEDKGLSHEVIAVAIEEMLVTAANASFPYLEGILRNWHSMGIRTYSDLLANPHLAKALAPVTAKKEDSPAEKRWREVFPDEFD
ncbi:MAG: DnaD domain protein [Firmicutes bacterium]|nr:DnaD domain protein [Bacillota bacterium]